MRVCLTQDMLHVRQKFSVVWEFAATFLRPSRLLVNEKVGIKKGQINCIIRAV